MVQQALPLRCITTNEPEILTNAVQMFQTGLSDSLASGRKIRALTIVDTYTRECLAMEVDTSLPGARVRRVLEGLARQRLRPEELRVDNGPEFISWAVAYSAPFC